MDESSPYLSPASPPPRPPLPQGPPPSAVKVFGIIHLVLSGLGVVFGLWSLASMQINSMIQGMAPGDPAMVVQRKYMEELWPVTVMSSIFSFGLAALLLVAGLKLVRLKPDGVMWSNRYAWTSITAKVIGLAVAVIYVLPLTNRMTGELFGSMPGMPAGSADTMVKFMKSVQSVSTVAGPVIMCLYPILALYFLSRPTVKAWAATAR